MDFSINGTHSLSLVLRVSHKKKKKKNQYKYVFENVMDIALLKFTT